MMDITWPEMKLAFLDEEPHGDGIRLGYVIKGSLLFPGPRVKEAEANIRAAIKAIDSTDMEAFKLFNGSLVIYSPTSIRREITDEEFAAFEAEALAAAKARHPDKTYRNHWRFSLHMETGVSIVLSN